MVSLQTYRTWKPSFSIAIMFFSTKTLSSARLYILILLVPRSIPNALFAKIKTPFKIIHYPQIFLWKRYAHSHNLLLLFDSGMHLLEELLLSTGTVNASLLSPREVYISAFRSQATHIMLLHNHPGGNPEPSSNDIRITKRASQP